MTANQTRFGREADEGYSSARVKRPEVREDSHSGSGAQREVPPVVYVYGDRICRKESKQRELYRQYRTSAAYSNVNGADVRKKRYKITIESIINLFDSVEGRGRQDVDAAKRNAIRHKKYLEHKWGILLAFIMITVLAVFAAVGYSLFFGISSIYADNTANYNGDAVIAASGVELGDKLYSFRADEAEALITFRCPYIRSVEVERSVPNRISFKTVSDQAAYCVNIYGELLVLSEGLRVLGHYDPEVNGVLTELCLPEIDYSVEGRVISFVNEKQDRFVREILSFLNGCGLKDRVRLVDLRVSYEVEMICDDLYLLKLGGEKDFERKLKMAEGALVQLTEAENGTPSVIDVGTLEKASVLPDHALDLTSRTVNP